MFDVAVADNVMEHLGEPDAVFAEINRLLKPGGVFLFKTPNVWHYMPCIARLTPTGFHKFYNKIRGRNVEDTFPTRYRANRKTTIVSLAQRNGFAVEYVEQIESRPEYLRISFLTYVVGIIYERLVNVTPALGMFRILLIARLRKLDNDVRL